MRRPEEPQEAPTLDRREKDLFRKLRDDFSYYAPRALKVRPKEGALIPFTLNSAQRRVHEAIEKQRQEKGLVRAIVLKGRQQGISTYVQGRFFWRITHGTGLRAFILTHIDATTDNLFGMVERFYLHCPEELKPSLGASNAKELSFKTLESGYKVATAGARGVGVGDTLQLFHGCLGIDTKIICGDTGKLRRVGDVALGDSVVTHTGAKAQVSYISTQTKAVKSVTMKGMRDFPLMATDEHRFWTRAGWRRLDELAAADCLGFPVQSIQATHVDNLPFALPHVVRPQGGGYNERVPASVPITYELGRIVGLYLAEGSMSKHSDPPHTVSTVIFSVHESEIPRTLEWLAAVGDLFGEPRVHANIGTKSRNVVVSGKSFANFLKNLVGRKEDKRFPKNWRQMGEPFVKGIVHGYLGGDGHSAITMDRRISLSSVRSATVIGLRDAVAALGYGWASVTFRAGGIHYGRNCRDIWTFRLTGRGVDRLALELGKATIIRQRPDAGNYGTVRIEGGYAWVPIVSIKDAGEQEVRDFEIDHPDHSYCTMHAATHNSEVSRWPNASDHISGALQAVPYAPGTEVIFESTSEGPTGIFFDLCNAAAAGESDYQFIFIPWFLQTEYTREPPPNFELTNEELETLSEFKLTLGQMAWRRTKIRELRSLQKFRQSYPATIADAWKVDAEGALWTRTALDACRVIEVPELTRVVVAVDPSGGTGARNDEVGIVVAGLGVDGRGYVLQDASGKYTPAEWGRKAVALFERWKADRIVAESNFGGAMVEANIRAANSRVPYKNVIASRGKQQRAEPVAALYEESMISHFGMHVALEDELCTWVPARTKLSPNRLDALVFALTELMLQETGRYDRTMKWVGTPTNNSLFNWPGMF